MDVDEVSTDCVELCYTERDDLVKKCMNNAFEKMKHGSDEAVPDDSSIFSYVPSKEKFVDYASQIMKSEVPTKEIARIMVADILTKYKGSTKSKRRITFDSDDSDNSDNEQDGQQSEDARVETKRPRLTRVGRSSKKKNSRNPQNSRNTRSSSRSIVETPETLGTTQEPVVQETSRGPIVEEVLTDDDMVTEPDETDYQNSLGSEESEDNMEVAPDTNSGKYPGLPVPLGHTSSGSMTSVAREYFPDADFVFPGIYILPGDTGYVLFCVDNGRYSNSWAHENNVTTLTWVTASKDKSRTALRAISESANVHVFRKISGETTFRYMGKVFRSDKMDKRAGTVELAVC